RYGNRRLRVPPGFPLPPRIRRRRPRSASASSTVGRSWHRGEKSRASLSRFVMQRIEQCLPRLGKRALRESKMAENPWAEGVPQRMPAEDRAEIEELYARYA